MCMILEAVPFDARCSRTAMVNGVAGGILSPSPFDFVRCRVVGRLLEGMAGRAEDPTFALNRK